MGKSGLRPKYPYKLGKDIILRIQGKIDLGMVIKDDLSPDKHPANIGLAGQ